MAKLLFRVGFLSIILLVLPKSSIVLRKFVFDKHIWTTIQSYFKVLIELDKIYVLDKNMKLCSVNLKTSGNSFLNALFNLNMIKTQNISFKYFTD